MLARWAREPRLAQDTAAAAARQALPVKSIAPLASVHDALTVRMRTTLAGAIGMLLERGFTFIGLDPVGLPCYRSSSGALLIAVGSCRSLAYAPVDGKLQVVAAARTTALVCRIKAPGGAVASRGRAADRLAAPDAAGAHGRPRVLASIVAAPKPGTRSMQ